MSEKPENRGVVAMAGIVMMFMLGSVYAWSVFKKPIMTLTGWSGPEVGFTFTLAILFLGLSAAFGGRFVDKAGSKMIATISAVLFGLGTIISGLAIVMYNLMLLWIGYGLIAGIGNGLGYITPIAILVRWFPDKKGLVTGFAIMGFGLGAALMGQVAPLLIVSVGVANTFYLSGIFFLITLLFAAQHLHNPPEGYMPAKKVESKAGETKAEVHLTFREALKMNQFYILWLTLFINVTAGIALISNMSPLGQSQVGLTAITAGTLIFVTSLFNGFGRLFWSSLSDKFGRKNIFIVIIATQIPLFFLLSSMTNVWVFGAACCWILLCYGGGFGTMPAFAADTFGSKNIGGIYGPILTAWGAAAVVGPMIMEYVKQSTNSFSPAFIFATSILIAGLIVVSFYRKPQISK
ncbi:MAG: OFA family MFS transporter [Candidatus Margulisiibacteriota bacterium]